MNRRSVEKVEITRLTGKKRVKLEDKVIRETPLTIFIGSQEVGTLLCTPCKVDYLAVGFLFTQGILQNAETIKDIYFHPERNFIQIQLDGSQEKLRSAIPSKNLFLSSCGACSSYLPEYWQNLGKINSPFTMKKDTLFEAMKDFEEKSNLFKITGGNHSSGLFDREKIEVFAEDIGRHNAVDKVIGECILKKIKTKDKALFLSGRVSWEILVKAFRALIPVVISPSAPTNLGIHLADTLNVTLVGFLRKERMNIYTHPWRIV
ncbi:formate dehydrogenase accessory sulfurtransferase FdhD [Candidatus Aerophobetes bacterium]|nr:formate dehydrogenase accessory sulfurtransferase FdhD [Candidatus Aerophobetes bacterium]